MSKISGPLLDRIDIHIEVPAVQYQELASEQPGTDSQQMRQQVVEARRRQAERFVRTRIRYNAQMTARQLRSFCRLGDDCRRLLENSVNELGLSARAHDKIIRVARTIADLEGAEQINAEHLQEAINYRMLDREFWN